MSEAPTLRDRLASWFATPLDADFRSAEHLERERWLLFAPSVAGVASPRFRRVYAVPAAFLAQLCVGSFYSTSIFNKWSDSHVWGAPGSNAGGFTACVAMYGLCSILLGAYITRNGAFRSTRIALVATPLGWLLMSLALRSRQLALLYGGYGVLHGLGCALTYLATTSMLQGWFPELKGLMSGIAVCGAGVGSYLWTSLGRALLDPAGAYRLDPPAVQLIFSVIFFSTLLVVLPLMRNAPPGFKPPPLVLPPRLVAIAPLLGAWLQPEPGKGGGPDKPYLFADARRQQEFWLLAFIVLGTSIAGAVFLSSAADMTVNLFSFDGTYAALVTSWLNLVNFTGRFGWGLVSDRLGRKSFFVLSAVTQTSCLALMTEAIRERNYPLWLACFLLLGSLYGGLFGVLPATLSDLFGTKISSATHGVMIAVWASGVVFGVPVFGAVTSRLSTVGADGHTITPLPEAYIVNASWLAVFPACAAVAALLLNLQAPDRVLRKESAALAASAAGAGASASAFLLRLPSVGRFLCTCSVRRLQPSEGAAWHGPVNEAPATVVTDAKGGVDEWGAQGVVALGAVVVGGGAAEIVEAVEDAAVAVDAGCGERDVRVLYASYGSNLLERRFLAYLQGGTVEGNIRTFSACPQDASGPRSSAVACLRGHRLRFARSAPNWRGGGVCFLELGAEQGALEVAPLSSGGALLAAADAAAAPSAPPTLLRLYDVSLVQFNHVVAAENASVPSDLLRLPTPDSLRELAAEGAGATRLVVAEAAAWYSRLVFLGLVEPAPGMERLPVLTFSTDEQQALARGELANAPSAAYRAIVEAGLRECGVGEREAAAYVDARTRR
jgi:MFS family permease